MVRSRLTFDDQRCAPAGEPDEVAIQGRRHDPARLAAAGQVTWPAAADDGAPPAAGGFVRYPLDHPLLCRHLEAACRRAALIERAAARHGLLPSWIAALGSRQSGWGVDLQPAGPEGGADGAPRGLMPLDRDRYALARGDRSPDPEADIEAACRIVAAHRSLLRRQSTLQGRGLLRGAFAAFAVGLEPVLRALRQGLDVDSATADCDYGRDVLERAAFFQAHGWD